MKKKKKIKSISTLKKEADMYFSRFIRKSYANDFGKVSCYTCSKMDDWENMQCGHFISRAHLSTRYDEQNCRVQCVGCNVFKNGNYTEFSYRLLKEIGEKGMDELMEKKKQINQIRRKDYEALILKYKHNINT